MRPYQKLVAWQVAHELCLSVYRLTSTFPKEERYGLCAQMRSSASSVPTNIAEGNGKSSHKEQARFLEISLCSLDELHYQTLLSFDLGYIPKTEFEKIMSLIARTGFLGQKLRSSIL